MGIDLLYRPALYTRVRHEKFRNVTTFLYVQFFLKKRKYLLSLRASFSTFAFFCILHSEEIQRVEIFRHSYQQDTASGSQPLSRSMTWLPASQPASGKKEVIFIAGAVATLLTHPGPAGAAIACPHRRRCAAAAARPSVRPSSIFAANPATAREAATGR